VELKATEGPLHRAPEHQLHITDNFTLLAQPDIGDTGPPELIHTGQHQVARQVRVDLPPVVGVGGHDELALAHAQPAAAGLRAAAGGPASRSPSSRAAAIPE